MNKKKHKAKATARQVSGQPEDKSQLTRQARSDNLTDSESNVLNTKDAQTFVEHVRAVHFALLVACVTLTIAAYNHSSIASQAINEMRTLRQLASGKLSHDNCLYLLTNAYTHYDSIQKHIIPENVGKPVFVTILKTNGFQTTCNRLLPAWEVSTNIADEHFDDVSLNLENFANRWNQLNPYSNDSYIAFAGKQFVQSRDNYLIPEENAYYNVFTPSVDEMPGGAIFSVNLNDKSISDFDVGRAGSSVSWSMSVRGHAAFAILGGYGIWHYGDTNMTEISESSFWRIDFPSPVDSDRVVINEGGNLMAYEAVQGYTGEFGATIKFLLIVSNSVISEMHCSGSRPFAFLGGSDLLVAFSTNDCSFHVVDYSNSTPNSTETFLMRVAQKWDSLSTSADGAWMASSCVDSTTNHQIWITNVKTGKSSLIDILTNDNSTGYHSEKDDQVRTSFSSDGHTLVVCCPRSFVAVRLYRLLGGDWHKAGNWRTDSPLGGPCHIACDAGGRLIFVSGEAQFTALSADDQEKLTELNDYRCLPFSEGSQIAVYGSNLVYCASGLSINFEGSLVDLGDDKEVNSERGSSVGFNLGHFGEDLTIPFSEKPENSAKIFRADIQSELLKQTIAKLLPQDWIWRDSGNFEDSFPALGQLYKPYRNLPFDEVQAALRAELKRSGDSVEAFGVKIPSEAVRRWGMIILLSVQFYFSRHLKILVLNHASKLKYIKPAWIGLYEDRLSRLATITTCSVFPVITCMVLYYQGAERVPQGISAHLSYLLEGGEQDFKWRIISLLGIGVSIALATIIGRDILTLSQKSGEQK